MTFQEENNLLLEKIISPFYLEWSQAPVRHNKNDNLVLELAITPECNQNCEYCYLVRHKDKIFPKETRDPSKIKENLNTLLSFYLEKKFSFQRIDLFSGEIWGTKFGFDILTIILTYVKQGLEIDSIIIPSNCSFLTNDKATNSVQYLIDEFDKWDVHLIFSASVDGKIVEDQARPFRDKKYQELKNDDFYTKLADFCNKNHYGIHPMVSAVAIESWIENYKWWRQWHRDNFKEDILQDPRDWLRRSMLLEVRNDDWTEDKILSYLKFYDYLIDDYLESLWLNLGYTPLDFFIYHFKPALVYEVKNPEVKILDEPYPYGNYDPTILANATDIPICSITRSLIVRLGDLAIIPCHRTGYDKFVYGYYIKDEETGELKIKATNPLLANKIYRMKITANPKCNNCVINKYCLKGCYGAQYETTGELFYPIDSVCNLYKARTIYLRKKILDFAKKYDLEKYIEFSLNDFEERYQSLISEREGLEWKKKIDEIF